MAQGCGESGGASSLVAKVLEALTQSELTGLGFFLRGGANRAGQGEGASVGSGETGVLWSVAHKVQELDTNQVLTHCLLLALSD